MKVCPLCFDSKHVESNSEDNHIPCYYNNVGHRWRWMKCKERNITKIYEGETGRSAWIRGLEQIKDLEKERKNSLLFKHIKSDHPNESVKFKLEITQKYQDALNRQANEELIIDQAPNSLIANLNLTTLRLLGLLWRATHWRWQKQE